MSAINSTEVQALQEATLSSSIFTHIALFEKYLEIAKFLSQNTLLPETYRDNAANCMLAMELSMRNKMPFMSVVQNLYTVNGRPGWSGKYVIAVLNTCGRFEPLQFEWQGEKGSYDHGCRAWTYMKGTDYRVEAPWVTWGMACDEGWVNYEGSPWRSMRDLMFQYRAASFFGSLRASDILLGLPTIEELVDAQKRVLKNQPVSPQPSAQSSLPALSAQGIGQLDDLTKALDAAEVPSIPALFADMDDDGIKVTRPAAATGLAKETTTDAAAVSTSVQKPESTTTTDSANQASIDRQSKINSTTTDAAQEPKPDGSSKKPRGKGSSKAPVQPATDKPEETQAQSGPAPQASLLDEVSDEVIRSEMNVDEALHDSTANSASMDNATVAQQPAATPASTKPSPLPAPTSSGKPASTEDVDFSGPASMPSGVGVGMANPKATGHPSLSQSVPPASASAPTQTGANPTSPAPAAAAQAKPASTVQKPPMDTKTIKQLMQRARTLESLVPVFELLKHLPRKQDKRKECKEAYEEALDVALTKLPDVKTAKEVEVMRTLGLLLKPDKDDEMKDDLDGLFQLFRASFNGRCDVLKQQQQPKQSAQQPSQTQSR